MFKYLIRVHPLGMLYGSAGAFLSPENLVGRSGAKFPPEASTLAGLFFSENFGDKELWNNLYVAGAFWGKKDIEQTVYVPIPRTYIIAKDDYTQWELKKDDQDQLNWNRDQNEDKKDLKSELTWFPLSDWEEDLDIIYDKFKEGEIPQTPWQYNPILHPKLETDQRHTVEKDGLFLENAVQMDHNYCLVYLSTHSLENGWYKFGGESHLVEIESIEIKPEWKEFKLFTEPIKANQGFALLTPAVWGSNRLSSRYPELWKNKLKFRDQEKQKPLLLTDKAIPYRYRTGGKLGRGRYAVPAGTVYVFNQDFSPWWEWDEKDTKLFPLSFKEVNSQLEPQNSSLKHLGCGLGLPINIEGLTQS
jgi:CRISPR-associated protein Cmr3